MGLKILLADDSTIMLDLLSNQLSSFGHEIVGKESTSEGVLAAYRRLRPDLLILDISFEGKDGLSVLREVRAFDPQANVLMVTANDQKGVRDHVTALGSSLLAKPFNLESLRSTVSAIAVKTPPRTPPTGKALSSEGMETLSRILNESALLSSRRISEFTGARWKVSISGLRAVSRDKVPQLFNQDLMPHMGAALFVKEPLSLGVVIFFPDWSLPPLVEAMVRAVPSLKNHAKPKWEVVSEIANIMGHGIMRTLADYCDHAFIAAAPTVAQGSKTEILAALISRVSSTTEAFFAQAEFYSDQQSSSATVLLLSDIAALFGLLENSGNKK